MSRVYLNTKSRIEFYMDFSKVHDETERAIALILFSHYRLDDGVAYVVDYDTFYYEVGKYNMSKEAAENALNSLEDKGFINQMQCFILLVDDMDTSTTENEMVLGKTGEVKLGLEGLKCDTTSPMAR